MDKDNKIMKYSAKSKGTNFGRFDDTFYYNDNIFCGRNPKQAKGIQ